MKPKSFRLRLPKDVAERPLLWQGLATIIDTHDCWITVCCGGMNYPIILPSEAATRSIKKRFHKSLVRIRLELAEP